MAEDAISLLRKELCDLARRAAEEDIPLIIGGGMGLALRNQMLRDSQATTLRSFHPIRPTTDLDVFLTTEAITDSSKTVMFRRIIDDLGYLPVEGALYYQFVKPLPPGLPLKEVKLDLLAPLTDSDHVKVGRRRIRPRGSKGLHAHVTREAMTIEEALTAVSLNCDGAEVDVFVPHPFSYVILKLFAFRDRRNDPDKLRGAYHAFDIYNSIAMMTAEEFEQGISLRDRFVEHQELLEAQRIGAEFFGSPTDLGILRIREHLRRVGIPEDNVDLDGFAGDLGDLLAYKGV